MNTSIDKLQAELAAAAERAASDPSACRATPAARTRLRDLRERLRGRLGTVDLAVPYIREFREK